MAGRTGMGHVTILNKVHIFHAHWGSQQAVNPGVHLYRSQMDSGPHLPPESWGVCVCVCSG